MDDNLKSMTAEIVAAFVSSNKIAATDLAPLIASVYGALNGMGTAPVVEVETQPVTKLSSAQIRKSITPDALISFEDGRPYKMLKRHLTMRGLTPAEYRAKWGLPADYPTTAPSYSAARSALAVSVGLGAKGRGKPVVAEAPKVKKAAPVAASASTKTKKATPVAAATPVRVKKARVTMKPTLPPGAIDPAEDTFT